jgi:hypothetical protein
MKYTVYILYNIRTYHTYTQMYMCLTKWAVGWIQSFLGLQTEGGGVVRGLACLTLGKRGSWNPAEMGKHEKKWRRTHSRRDEGGSAANRVRRLLPLITG